MHNSGYSTGYLRRYTLQRGIPVVVTQPVIDYCSKFDRCRGCRGNCSAPESSELYNAWLELTVIAIEQLHEKELNK